MLNFAEQTGSGAVMLVWSFLTRRHADTYTYPHSQQPTFPNTLTPLNFPGPGPSLGITIIITTCSLGYAH